MNFTETLSSDLLRSLRLPSVLTAAVAGLAPHILLLYSPALLRLSMIVFIHAIVVPVFVWFALSRLQARAEKLEQANFDLKKTASDLARRNAQIDALNSACRLLSGAPSVSAVLEPLTQLTMRVAQADAVKLTWRADRQQEVCEYAGADLTDNDTGEFETISLTDTDIQLGAIQLRRAATDELTRKSVSVLVSEICLRWRLRNIEGNALSALYNPVEEAIGIDGDKQTLKLLSAIGETLQATGVSIFVQREGVWQRRVHHGKCPELNIVPASGDRNIWFSEDRKEVYLRGAPDGILVLHGLHTDKRTSDALNLPLLRMVAGHCTALLRVTDSLAEMLWAERQRIGRELHDDVCQSLASLHMQLRHLSDLIASGRHDEAGVRCQELHNDALMAYDATRRAVDGFRMQPTADEAAENFLAKIAGGVCKRLGVDLKVTSGPMKLNAESSWQLGRVLQEAITNAVQHGHAGSIKLNLFEKNGQSSMVIEDDGDGSGAVADGSASHRAHHGVSIMKERLAAMHGSIKLSRRRKATQVRVSVPNAIF